MAVAPETAVVLGVEGHGLDEALQRLQKRELEHVEDGEMIFNEGEKATASLMKSVEIVASSSRFPDAAAHELTIKGSRSLEGQRFSRNSNSPKVEASSRTAVCNVALESILGIAEAYDSEQGSDEPSITGSFKQDTVDCEPNAEITTSPSSICCTSLGLQQFEVSVELHTTKQLNSSEIAKVEPLVRKLPSPSEEQDDETRQGGYNSLTKSRKSEAADTTHKLSEVRQLDYSDADSFGSRWFRARASADNPRHLFEGRERVEHRDSGHRHGHESGTVVSIEQGKRSRLREAVPESSEEKGRRSRSRETNDDYGNRRKMSGRSRFVEEAYNSNLFEESTRKRSRRSRSRELQRYFRHTKDGLERHEHRTSFDVSDSGYARFHQERLERDQHSRSNEALHRSKQTPGDLLRFQETADVGKDSRDSRAMWKRSRSIDGGEKEYLGRRSKKYTDLRSRERSQHQRMNDSVLHGSGRQKHRERSARVVEGDSRHTLKQRERRHLDIMMRKEVFEEECQTSLQSEDEDVEKQVDMIRIRRQAILERHKRQEQSESVRILNINSEHVLRLGANDSMGDAKIVLGDNSSVFLDHSLQSGIPEDLSGTTDLSKGSPKSKENSIDMFNDYNYEESPAAEVQKQMKGDQLALETSDNWDDAEGYYCHHIREVLVGRYEIAACHGRGVFSTVLRARDVKANKSDVEEVAIKIIRNNDVLLKFGHQELSILKLLNEADPENKWHCVRFLTSFDYRKHLCLVFESMHMNLREVMKKSGIKIGLDLGVVRTYAKQLFTALKHLKNCRVLHCDIKPDNLLVNEAKNVLKLCDFGSAMLAGDNEITPNLVSRFYRAPEIILGLPYNHSLDMWSVGCCLYEFFTGKILFHGPTNNVMLRLHMELKGPFPKKMLKKACFTPEHFDQDHNFCAVEEDAVTKATFKRVLVNVKQKGIASLVKGGGADGNVKMLNHFRDLLDKIFTLDPERRLTVSQALHHSFITGK